MNLTYGDGTISGTISSVDFLGLPEVSGGIFEKTGVSTTGNAPLSAYGTNVNVSISIDRETLDYLGHIAASSRLSGSQTYTEEEANSLGDKFMNSPLPMALYDGECDLTEEDVQEALDGMENAISIDFLAIPLRSSTSYILRADVGPKKITFFLVPELALVTPDPASEPTVLVDTLPFMTPDFEDEELVDSTEFAVDVEAFKVAVIEKEVTFTGRPKMITLRQELLGLVFRAGHNYGDLVNLYEGTVKGFSKTGYMGNGGPFLELPAPTGGIIPSILYGVNNSENAFVIIDTSTLQFVEMGNALMAHGTATVKFVVGSISFPSGVHFKERLNYFDLLLDEEGSCGVDGPMSSAYSGIPISQQPECMHSWEGRTSITLRKISKESAGSCNGV